MLQLAGGLLLFLAPHSIRLAGEGWRKAIIGRVGEGPYKGLYSLLSIAGLVLLVRGYGEIRTGSPLLFSSPAAVRHLALLVVPIAIVLVTAAYTPAGYIKRTVRHPMIAGVALWALVHLLANGRVADLVLFGAFFIWAILDLVASLRRQPQPVTGRPDARGDVAAVLVGLLVSAFLLGGGHLWLFGVSPLA